MQEFVEEIWQSMNAQDDSEWTCYCGNEYFGIPLRVHKVAEHNKVTHEALKCVKDNAIESCEICFQYICEKGCENAR